MEMYMSYRSIPELEGIEKGEAKRLFQKAWAEGRKRPGNGRALLALGLCAGVAAIVGGLFAPGAIGSGIGGGIGGALGGLYYSQFVIARAREVLREQGCPRCSSGLVATGKIELD